MVIYDGPSQLNGDPILGIITGMDSDSTNSKTGPMAQLYIISAADHPVNALKDGSDASICGDCKHRPVNMGSCYVVVAQGTSAVFRAWQQGKYDMGTPEQVNQILRDKGKSIRLGAYGDPAALPLQLLQRLTAGLRFTGYTHQWRTCHPDYKLYTMASVDTPEEHAQAKRMGWRTFRVRLEDEPLANMEIICPASEEAGFRTTCARCVLCMGTQVAARDIAIVVHGQHTKKFVSLRRGNGTEMEIRG